MRRFFLNRVKTGACLGQEESFFLQLGSDYPEFQSRDRSSLPVLTTFTLGSPIEAPMIFTRTASFSFAL